MVDDMKEISHNCENAADLTVGIEGMEPGTEEKSNLPFFTHLYL